MNWHAISEKEVLTKLNSDKKGLSTQEALKRLEKFGYNRINKIRNFNTLKIFLNQFKSFLILILIFAAILSFLMDSIVDSIVILSIVLINTLLGFTQEYKAGKAIENLKKLTIPISKVMRNGKLIELSSEELVPGDILHLNEGDKIPADARLIECENLLVNESALTGESVPEEKNLEILDSFTPILDRANMIYQGCDIISGTGIAIVVNTGMKTELGKISELVQKVVPDKNPFTKKLDSFGQKIGIFVLFLIGITLGVLLLNDMSLIQSFSVSVSLAVSAIPEGLPAVVSLCLAFATLRMYKKNVLVRKLHASETLGRVSVICSDKTGTMTLGKMQVAHVYSNGKLDPEEDDNLLYKIGILCNKARLEIDENGKGYMIGDPTEQALIISAQNHFLDKNKLTEKEVKVKEFAFNSGRKMMSIIRKSDKKLISYVKGAPEKIIEISEFELINGKKIKIDSKRREYLTKVYETMAEQGLRVLAFAYKELPHYSEEISQEYSESNLTLVGFQGMMDPPREEVKGAIKLCEEAGIKVIMITGDSKLTAIAVAKEIGIVGKSLDSPELQKLSDNQLLDKIDEIRIFSRISPEDKLRIINILKKKNEIVAMTGDGVNDSLALKRADIGVAMGIRGTDVAKDSSDIIILDDNFSSIVTGVEEGRRIYDNTKKFIKFLLSANFSQVFLVLLVILIWRDPAFLPLLPLQILWINLVTDSLPALALTTLPGEKDLMKRKLDKTGILKGIRGFILVAGIISLIIGLIVFINYIEDITKARTLVTTGAILFEMMLVFNAKSRKSAFRNLWNKYIFGAVAISIILHLIVMYTSLNRFFYFSRLNFYEWGLLIGLCFMGFLIIELYKYAHDKILKYS